MTKKFKKILIANRGEIALRIIRTAHQEGIQVVSIYSEGEERAPHVVQSDESYTLGKGSLSETYLNISKIIKIATISGAEAIHPGYGFLSENSEFALACQDTNIQFIGPSSAILATMGNKIQAKQAAEQAGIPILKSQLISDSDGTLNCDNQNFPLLIKAAHGGGGKGMQIVYSNNEFQSKLAIAIRNAINYFGNGEVFIEHYLEKARHIEVQILGDQWGNQIHLYDRDCTLQRNHQKIIEEAPVTAISDEIRDPILEAALKIAKFINYQNAGTIEFLVEPSGKFYFLEMNPRIQVEHCVTEDITNIDIVKEQLSIAAGNQLPFKQSDIHVSGHSIQARIYTEDPLNLFKPSTEPIIHFELPQNVRIETDLNTEKNNATQFDPLVCKLISRSTTRNKAISKLETALQETIILGPTTNRTFLHELLKSQEFIKNHTYTHFIEDQIETIVKRIHKKQDDFEINPLIATFLFYHFHNNNPKNDSIWDEFHRWRHIQQIELEINQQKYAIEFTINQNNIRVNNYDFEAIIEKVTTHQITGTIQGKRFCVYMAEKNEELTFIQNQGKIFTIRCSNILTHHPKVDLLFLDANQQAGSVVNSPLHGKIVEIKITNGQEVNKGDQLLAIESMKSENWVLSPRTGKIKTVLCKNSDQVADGIPLVIFEDR